MIYPQPPAHYEYASIDKHDSNHWVKQQAFLFMNHLEGWCSKLRASICIDLILKSKPETVVEIGVFGGKSLIPMACALKANGTGKIYGIDAWDSVASIQGMQNETNKAWWGSLDHEAIRKGLVAKLKEFNLEKQVELIVSTSENANPIKNIRLLHIDGNHSDAASYLDVTKWVPLVESEGWIVFDGMSWCENGSLTTARAVAWLDTHCIKIAEFKDEIDVWGLWVKP